MRSHGNLYDYPRESIERRKLVRQLRRVQLEAGSNFPILGAGSEITAGHQTDLYNSILALEDELARCERANKCVLAEA